MSRLLTISLLASLLFGCSTIHKTSNQPVALDSAESVYIIENPYQREDIGSLIQKEINDLGMVSELGPSIEKQRDFDYIITYFDSWTWDLIPYLRAIEIQLIDPSSTLIVTRARFQNSVYLHSYPSEEDKVHELVREIFKKHIAN
jgi:hypothetical protein